MENKQERPYCKRITFKNRLLKTLYGIIIKQDNDKIIFRTAIRDHIIYIKEIEYISTTDRLFRGEW